MRIGERIKRWRGRRGYGIHSPLAFRIVKNVVRPQRGTVYYGEEELLHADAPMRQIKESRLLLRFVAQLQPATVWVSSGTPEIYKEAVRRAGCVIRMFDGNIYPSEHSDADMTVLFKTRLKKKELHTVLRPGHSLIGFHLTQAFKITVRDAMKGGVVIDGVGFYIAVSTDDASLHAYEV